MSKRNIYQTETLVADYIRRHHMLQTGERVIVGLSGGADSVCLALMLRRMDYEVEAVHCNFHLRGPESDRDEQFCQHFCQQHAIPLHIVHFQTENYAREHRQSIEMAAREQRYEAFEKIRRERSADHIAVAHHRDDNVETFLLNLLRGTGINGLCAIPPVNGRVVRPLLVLARQQILNYVEGLGSSYVTDSTNLGDHYLRNRVRHHLLPLMQQLNPAAVENMQTTIDNLHEVRKMYAYCLDEFAAASLDGPESININMVQRAPSPLTVLHELLTPFHFRRSQLLGILAALTAPGRIFLSDTHRVLIDREQIIIEPIDGPQLADDGPQPTADDQLHFVRLDAVPTTFSASPRVAYFDADKLVGPLHVRTVQPGDRFVPFGMKGSRLVSDFLTDLKVNRFDKERQRVLCCGDEIAWVVGRRSSNLFRVDDTTRRVLMVSL